MPCASLFIEIFPNKFPATPQCFSKFSHSKASNDLEKKIKIIILKIQEKEVEFSSVKTLIIWRHLYFGRENVHFPYPFPCFPAHTLQWSTPSCVMFCQSVLPSLFSVFMHMDFTAKNTFWLPGWTSLILQGSLHMSSPLGCVPSPLGLTLMVFLTVLP